MNLAANILLETHWYMGVRVLNGQSVVAFQKLSVTGATAVFL